MNVASLNLCKELYELSLENWKGEPSECTSSSCTHHAFYDNGTFIAPKYGLGYLLRKLPNYPPNGRMDANYYDRLIVCKLGTKYEAYYWNTVTNRRAGDSLADTPEDVVAKLAIELFKQGILK